MKYLVSLFAVVSLSAQVKSFDSPDAAAHAAIIAAQSNDLAGLEAIFGKTKGVLTSGDPKQDAQERAEFARVASGRSAIEKDPMNPHRVFLVIGPEDWPFPVPIVEKDGKWSFDPTQGEIEVRARRIGANEIDVIDLCAGYVEAQRQYAQTDRKKNGMLEYAEFLMSSPGKSDGLYSDSAPRIPKEFALAEVRASNLKPVPYLGYYFRVLTSQSASPYTQARRYIVNGKHMIGGFALVAWPAQYGVTGIHTFIVNQDGVVYEKDMGAPASNLTPPVRSYAPDRTWTRVDE
ncbi:MAG TPA: DUF2950 family protein [Bryobacteraceae bacterium]|nr:DUF2950 family protein [Bryobacteraceae bacterium]